jgi:hypothetical protein
MKLYLIQVEDECYYVEADNMIAAIVAWRVNLLAPHEEPEVVTCVADTVIRPT